VGSLVIGASGMVGSALLRALQPDTIGTYRTRAGEGLRHLDARDAASVERLVKEVRPTMVYFPAAEPNVDWCEQHPDDAWHANVEPALSALQRVRAADSHFVFFSSDYVFDGRDGPYDEEAEVGPLSVYGRQKREVEERVLGEGGTVVRTTTVFGEELPPGKNFVVRLVARLRAGETATIPADQFATPTWSDELARGVVGIGNAPGIWHVAGPDFMVRTEFAGLIAEVFGCDQSLIRPVSTDTLHQAARRPLRAGLKTEKLRQSTGVALISTRDALRQLAARA
jgi:dTDP-4-dehydrorhamnose reductase